MIRIGYMMQYGRYGVWCYNDVGQAITESGLVNVSPGLEQPVTTLVEKPQVQQLMDDLWAQGFRPAEWGHEGQVKALGDHLQDMRRLVFEVKS